MDHSYFKQIRVIRQNAFEIYQLKYKVLASKKKYFTSIKNDEKTAATRTHNSIKSKNYYRETFQ